jgi:YD repeat-containing protein
MDNLMKQKFIIQPVITKYYKNDVWIGKEEWRYKIENDLVVPSVWYKSTNDPQILRPEITFDKYDSNGYLLSFTDKDGLKNALIWDIMIQKPTIHVKNMNYDAVLNLIGETGIRTFKRRFIQFNRDYYLSLLRNQGKNVNVFFYDYTPTGYLKKRIESNGKGLIYTYDKADRLSSITTLDNILLESYKYDYRIEPYSTDSPY